MIPQENHIDFSKCNNRSKGLDTENATFCKYGKEILIKDYINEYHDGTNAKEIIQKAGGLNNLPHTLDKIKDAEITVDMNEDLYTINRKIKLGQMAQRKIDAIKAEQTKIAAEQAATKPVEIEEKEE